MQRTGLDEQSPKESFVKPKWPPFSSGQSPALEIWLQAKLNEEPCNPVIRDLGLNSAADAQFKNRNIELDLSDDAAYKDGKDVESGFGYAPSRRIRSIG